MNANGNFSRQQFIGGLAAAFGGLILPADAFGAGTPIRKFRLGNDITADVQSRIDAAFKAGGGTVSIGKGEWTIRGIRLRSNVTLHLAAGAVVRASRNMDDFDVLAGDVVEPLSEVERDPGPAWLPPGKRPAGWKGPLLYPCSRWNCAIFSVYKARNVRIVGEQGAVIDGMNSYDPQGEEGFRGAHGIMAFDSENIEVRGVEIRRTGNWATRFFRCHDVAFRDLKVRGGHDGVHVRLCDRVIVKGCDFRCGDDCVAGFDNADVTVEDCRMNTACSAFRFGGRHVRIRRCTAAGPGEWPIRNSLSMDDRSAGRDCLGQGRRNMLSFFTYFADLSHGGVKADQGDILIEDCTVKDVDRFLHYNFSGNEVWQCGRPLRDVTFRRCTATGLGMSLCAYGAEKLPLALKIEECSFSFARPTSEFIRAAHLDSLKADRVTVDGVTGPFVRYWGERAPTVEASAVEGMGTEVRPATEVFKTQSI